MQKHMVLKKLLTGAAVAAMFSAFGVHAQAGGSGNASGTGQDATAQTGKTTREGTAGNTNSVGKDEKMGGSSTQSTRSGSGSGNTMHNIQDTTGAGNPNTTGKTMAGGTMGNTESTGMEKRGGHSSGASGAGGSTAFASLGKGDERILMEMAQASIDEIAVAKIAQSKSQNDQVKSFAQQMIDDHSKALNDVQQLAQQKGVTLPTEPDARHKAMAARLEAMSGAAFDKAYMSQAGVSDHKAVHSKLMSASKKAKDSDVKNLAEKMLPVVEQHLKSAEQDKSAMAGTKSGR